MLWLPSLVALLPILALAADGLDKCFDGTFWMDPSALVPREKIKCPAGYQPAILPDPQAHVKAAMLGHRCVGPNAAIWIGATMDSRTHGGSLALMVPSSVNPEDPPEDRRGGVMQPLGDPRLAVLCERLDLW